MRHNVTRLFGTKLAGIGLVCGAVCHAQPDIVETREITERIVPADAANLEIVVDNIFGSIRVIGHDEAVIEFSAIETVIADSQEEIERARAQVSLQIEQEAGRAAFVVRREGECDCNFGWGRRRDGYIVAYDMELRVPREAALNIATVNRGDIEIDGVRGRFRVANVNGDVTLRGLRAAGHAQTVNGELTAAFERSPDTATSFETINGEIDVTFPDDVSADLYFKTVRGEIWTDFEVTALPVAPITEAPRGRRTVISGNQHAAVRIDAGGPSYTFETLNGDITVRESH